MACVAKCKPSFNRLILSSADRFHITQLEHGECISKILLAEGATQSSCAFDMVNTQPTAARGLCDCVCVYVFVCSIIVER